MPRGIVAERWPTKTSDYLYYSKRLGHVLLVPSCHVIREDRARAQDPWTDSLDSLIYELSASNYDYALLIAKIQMHVIQYDI